MWGSRLTVGFLRVGAQSVVVPVEREEGGQLHPAVAELLVAVAVETTGVDAEHGDAEETERQGLRDTEVHVRPLGVTGSKISGASYEGPDNYLLITTPMTSPFSGSCESGAANNERPLSRENIEQALIRRVQNLVTE